MFSLPHTDHVVPKAYSNGPDLAMYLSLLLDIYNALPDAHHTKSLITDYIVAFAATNDKAH